MKNMIGKEILNYRIEKELGKGGMGSVYLSVNKNINQKVAIKVLNENLAGSVVIRKKFRDEAQLLCSLNHPNIVKFLNFVENEDGVFLIMDLVDGITLEDFINSKNGLIVEKRAYDIFDQILSAFAYAHKKGVVHRDIKPANIILTNDSDGNFVPKVLDFGIATIVSESTETEKGWVVGTPAYMSPEQVLGVNVDARSDIYSLGVLLFQMLTGRAPYDTTTLSELEINNKVVKDPLPRMKEFYPYISDKTQKLVDKATSKEKEQRFQNCNDFRKMLKSTLKPDPIKRVIKISAAALVLLLLGGGFWYWDYNRIKTYYYKDYVEQWGVPQGIHKLSVAQFRHREASYRFEYTQRKLRTLARVNSKGNVVVMDIEAERFDRPINATFSYRANGNIDYELYLNRFGKVLLKKSYDEGKNGKINLIIFRYNDEFGLEKKLPKDMTGYVELADEYAERGNISRFAVTFDNRGYISSMHYRNENLPVGDGEHLYGKRYERDEKGRVIKEYLLGHDDETRATSWGLGIKQFEYDAEDNWVKAVYLSPDGSPSYATKDGISVVAMEYDHKYGNMTYRWYLDSDNNLILLRDAGIAGYKTEYNDQGQRTQLVYLGTDKNPVYSSSRGYVGVEYEYDDNGNDNKESYIDENGQPTVKDNGVAFHRSKSDAKGRVLEVQFFNMDSLPYAIPDGYSRVVFEYDNLGNPISYFYYDINNSLCLRNGGYAGLRIEYNEQNKKSKTTSYGTDGLPCEDKNGNIVTKFNYDTRGNEIKRIFYESDEKTLKLSNDGIAGWKSEYESGKEIKRELFDEKEQPTSGYFDYAKWEAPYDDLGNQTEIIYSDEKDSFIKGTKYVYDEIGNLVERFPIGKDKKLAQGYLIARYRYDGHSNTIEWSLYDHNNKLAMNTAGYAKITYTYDGKNQETERRYYGANGSLIVNETEGYAIRQKEYDNKGNNTKTSFFGASEKPIKGYATAISEFDNMGRVIRETYFDENDKPTKVEDKIPELIIGYDKWGNKNYAASGDGSGNIIDNPKIGFAIHRYEYDIRGNKISESFFNKEDKPCIDTIDAVYKIDYVYNKQNRQTEIRYYDTDNKPCVNKQDNIHKIETIYDGKGNITEERYYDATVSLRKSGFAIEKYKRDEQGRLIEYAMYDYLDRPVNDGGYHRYVRSYDDASGFWYDKNYTVNGNVTSEWKKDPNTEKWTRTDTWRVYFENSIESLPITLNNYTRVTAITLSGYTCTVRVRINFSKYELSNTDMLTLETEGKNNAESWWKDSKMPSNATVVVVGLDNAGRELYSVSY